MSHQEERVLRERSAKEIQENRISAAVPWLTVAQLAHLATVAERMAVRQATRATEQGEAV
jgi:hypothetical protein